jgi:hypothetical protein
MENLVFEGTWEEIALRGHELAGRRDRVTVLDEPGRPAMLDRALAPLIEEAERLSRQLPPMREPLPADGVSAEVADKFRRQGFEL